MTLARGQAFVLAIVADRIAFPSRLYGRRIWDSRGQAILGAFIPGASTTVNSHGSASRESHDTDAKGPAVRPATERRRHVGSTVFRAPDYAIAKALRF